ncbi:MAG TPA: HTTM domain-containing protein, partial [Verrucomicrobiae bacterium]|nr:HTTM domain-containing protein [Verrucomicrobiae bacterium]
MKSHPPQRARHAYDSRTGKPAVAGQSSSGWARWKARLARPVNGASLAVFRISVGLVMALEAWSLVRPDPAAISSGRTPLDTYYTGAEITFHFPYELFSWLPLFPPRWIEALVLIQALAGIMMAMGFFYRISAAAVF